MSDTFIASCRLLWQLSYRSREKMGKATQMLCSTLSQAGEHFSEQRTEDRREFKKKQTVEVEPVLSMCVFKCGVFL